MMVFAVLGWSMTALALSGAVFTVLAAVLAGRFKPVPATAAAFHPPLTILKPLHGNEPHLEDNLRTFFVQDYPAPYQIVFGVGDETDPAIAVVEKLRGLFPGRDVVLATGRRRHGANPKVSNLLNLTAYASHDVVFLSDSDIAVPPDYLVKVAEALAPLT